jgi:hypothetical protein
MSTDASSYLPPAFYSQYNLILLGGSALFSLASASPWPAVFGVTAELAARAVGERRARLDDEVSQNMRGLGPELTARASAVSENVTWITTQNEESSDDPLAQAARLELEALRPAFVRLCQLRERLLHLAEEMRLAPPEHELAELSRAYAAEKDIGQRFTLHQGIKAAQRKVEQQQRLASVLRQVDVKLSLVEDSLVHLRHAHQQGLTGADLARDVQALMMHVLLVPALEAELEV